MHGGVTDDLANFIRPFSWRGPGGVSGDAKTFNNSTPIIAAAKECL